jgi:hypothetical protein
MSAVTPKVYSFAPGAKTPAAVINGVKRVMDAAGVHHWEEIPGSYTINSTITLRDKATGNRRLRLLAVTTGTPSPSVYGFYSFDGGLTESPASWLTGGPSSGSIYYNIGDSTYGISTDLAYVVEVEDAITIAGAKGSNGGTALVADALGMSIHAGRTFSAHNRSDSAGGVGEEGIVSGQMMVYFGSSWSWLTESRTLTRNYIWTGESFSEISIAVSANVRSNTQWRDKSVSASIPLLENVGDNQSIERLTPYPIAGMVSGASAFGHISYSRYFRARKFNHGETTIGGLIENTTVLQSAGDPNVGWRHNFGWSSTNVMRNTIHIWCPPGQETIVD